MEIKMSEKHNCITFIVDGNFKTAYLGKTITSHDIEYKRQIVTGIWKVQ